MIKGNVFRKKSDRVDPVQLTEQAERSLRETKSQQEHVNALVNYLVNRKGQNGFGEDFDITIRAHGRA